MVGKGRNVRAIHEASHSVIARKLGIAVPRASARSSLPHVMSVSAGYHADRSDVVAQIVGFEADAKVALAGWAANRREHPLRVFDLLEDADADTINAKNAICCILLLKAGEPVPNEPGEVSVELERMDEEYWRLIAETAALVDQYWPAIRRVAKHLERHDNIDQAELDRLIDVGMRAA